MYPPNITCGRIDLVIATEGFVTADCSKNRITEWDTEFLKPPTMAERALPMGLDVCSKKEMNLLIDQCI